MDAVDNYTASLTGGGAKDYAQYRESVGYVAGLRAALKIAIDIEEDYEKQ